MTAHPEVSSCPADETLAAFLDGRLTGADRDAVIAHLASCGDCRSLVIDATELRAIDDDHNVVRPQFGRSRWRAVAGAIAVAAALIVVFGPALRERWLPSDIQKLAKAYDRSSVRHVEGRLSGEFEHRRYQGPKRGPGDDPDDPNRNHLLEAEAALIAETSSDPHARGLSRLMLGEREKAIDALRSALQTAKGDERAAIANDLAVALIWQGAWLGRNDYFEEALRIVDSELRTKRTPELLWNRALALQNLGRREEARRAWEEYLQVDSTSPWAQEVRDRYLRGDAS